MVKMPYVEGEESETLVCLPLSQRFVHAGVHVDVFLSVVKMLYLGGKMETVLE